MFTMKCIQSNGSTEVFSCAHYSTGNYGGVIGTTGATEGIALYCYDADTPASKVTNILSAQTAQSLRDEGNYTPVVVGVYVMNEHGRTVDRIGFSDTIHSE